MKKKKLFFYLGFFVLLTVGFYYGLTKVIPGYGKVKLPVLSYVQPFHFENQDGKPVDERVIQGKVYVAEFFFTTCKSICPIMNRNLLPIYEEFKNEPGFMILSHTSDPETDSAARLKVYAQDSLNVNTDRWMFVTGRKDSLYNAARNSYLLDDPKNNIVSIDQQFLHTQFFALVDKSGRVRKIYDGLKKDELEQMKKDIRDLLAEPVKQERFKNNMFGN
ncbi:SCO family protein [Pseudoflavitalea rhizosphaerae]|uniref:SCO family protein n=1 Tax=Pseudoflavitalea rhizosphaerae TaxID=1884793 RepID=UPI000F8CE0EB|nr:SCO family protein [Pseudoflavitalea rhizosphaerae]